MANEITIDFGTLNLDSTNNIAIAKISMQSKMSAKLSSIPQISGSIAETGKITSMEISVSGDIAGTDYDDLRTNLDTLRAGFQNSFQKFTTDDDRYMMAQLVNFTYSFKALRTIAEWKAKFVAHYPYWLSETEHDNGTFMANGNFEKWTAGAAVAPDGWAIVGVASSIARNAGPKVGTYCAALTRAGTDCYMYPTTYATPPKGIAYYRGKVVTAGCWVYATVASRVRIGINDGVSATQYSSYHSGTPQWEWLTVTITVPVGATQLYPLCAVDTGDTIGYFDGAVFEEGATATEFTTDDITINNAGNVPARIKIEVTPSVEMADDCKIENTTTGKSFQHRGTVAISKVLEVDNRYDTDDFEVLNDSADDTVNFEGDFLTLDPGDNVLRLTSTVGVLFRIKHKDTWY